MLVANGLAGFLFTLANNPAGQIARVPGIGKAEFATFGSLLDSLILLSLPAGGLQAVFAQLASGAVDDATRAKLRGTARTVLTVVLTAWTLMAFGAWLGRSRILTGFQIANPWALVFTLGTVLVGLLYPCSPDCSRAPSASSGSATRRSPPGWPASPESRSRSSFSVTWRPGRWPG